MRFYGVGSEEKLLEIIKSIDGGEWIVEEKGKDPQFVSSQEVREKLSEIFEEIKKWKAQFATLAQQTIFAFVHTPDDPRAFKIYDTSSLGCGTSLVPPRWKIYIRELEGFL